MMYKKAITILQALLIGLSLFSGLTIHVAAQGVCVPETLSISVVTGRVVSQIRSGEIMLPQASVTLLEDRAQGRVIAETTADENGHFRFEHIKKGNYVLKVSHPNLATHYGSIRVVRTKTIKTAPQPEIIVTLGADFGKPCGGSHAEIRSKKNN